MIFAVNLHVVSYMYGINLLAVLIFFVSKCSITEVDEFFQGSGLINVEANYW